MAFPVVASQTTNQAVPASHNIVIQPCAVGDVIVVWLGVTDPFSTTTLDGFTRASTLFAPAGNDRMFCFWHVVTGAETWYNGGAGGNVGVTHSPASDTLCAYVILRITGVDPATSFPYADAQLSSSAAPDPPNLVIGGVTDTLWLAAFVQHDSTLTIISDPAGYANINSSQCGSSFIGLRVAIDQRSAAAASENPGAFTTDKVQPWWAATIGLRALPASAQGFAQRSGPLRRFRRY